jgi:hypothetical protein
LSIECSDNFSSKEYLPPEILKSQKITHISRDTPEYFVSWDFNISGRRYSFELKFSGHSIDK